MFWLEESRPLVYPWTSFRCPCWCWLLSLRPESPPSVRQRYTLDFCSQLCFVVLWESIDSLHLSCVGGSHLLSSWLHLPYFFCSSSFFPFLMFASSTLLSFISSAFAWLIILLSFRLRSFSISCSLFSLFLCFLFFFLLLLQYDLHFCKFFPSSCRILLLKFLFCRLLCFLYGAISEIVADLDSFIIFGT